MKGGSVPLGIPNLFKRSMVQIVARKTQRIDQDIEVHEVITGPVRLYMPFQRAPPYYDLSPKDISAQSYLQGSVYAL